MMSLRVFVTLVLCGLVLLPSSTKAGWQTDGNPICDETGSQIDPQLVPDGEGGVLIVWSDTRFGSQDIFAQRVDAYGNELWDPNGVPVCTAAATQSGPKVALSGLGGAIVAWTDQRNSATTGNDIYIQKLDPNGVVSENSNDLSRGHLQIRLIHSLDFGHYGPDKAVYAYAIDRMVMLKWTPNPTSHRIFLRYAEISTATTSEAVRIRSRWGRHFISSS